MFNELLHDQRILLQLPPPAVTPDRAGVRLVIPVLDSPQVMLIPRIYNTYLYLKMGGI